MDRQRVETRDGNGRLTDVHYVEPTDYNVTPHRNVVDLFIRTGHVKPRRVLL